MPGIEDWTSSPLNSIQDIMNKHGIENENAVKEYFNKKLATSEAINQLPSLNDSPLHSLRPNSVVRFRCMIQDMFDPEYYLSAYSVTDIKTKQTRMKSGKYRDVADSEKNEEINMDARENVTSSRQSFYCVPLPGETDWVKSVYRNMSGSKAEFPSTSNGPARSKRSLDCESEMTGNGDAPDVCMDRKNNSETSEMETEDSSVKITNGATNGATQKDNGLSVLDLNYPLPGEAGPPCIVKVYDGTDSHKLNDSVEFIGILSVHPSLAYESTSEEGDMDELDFSTPEEKNAHCPPPSLVPRLHCILSHKLQHNNPHLPQNLTSYHTKSVDEIAILRSKFLSILELLCLGDSLVAEYLLCHLMSTVYSRRDVMPVGKFCLNVSNCPAQCYTTLITKALVNFLTKVYVLDMTLENMNKLNFVPEKDYQANRLKSGILQLSDDTHLILDETVLEAGQLDTNGVKNITALGNIIKWQKMDYNFIYHQQEFLTNISVLILSEGKSLLPSDFHVPLENKDTPADLPDYFLKLDGHVPIELMTSIQSYLGFTRHQQYSMSDSLNKVVQEDFVQIRKEDTKNMSTDDFLNLLNLLRLLALSHGIKEPTIELWNKAKAMEHQRKQRVLQNQPAATSS